MSSRVLVVEDDRSWQQIIVELLNDAGLSVDVVDNLVAAETAISRRSHRLAIIDLSLVGIDHSNHDGLAVMNYIKQHDPGCVMIMLSGFATVEIAVKAISEMGAFTCLRKEMFNRTEFNQLISKALSLPSKVSLLDPSIGINRLESLQEPQAGLGGISVLVVDDDAGWRDIFKEILEDAGYSATLCSNYGEALGFMKRDNIDVAIIDLSLAGHPVRLQESLQTDEALQDFEGFHLLDAFRTRNTATIVVSGEASIRDINSAFDKQEIFAFIEKQTFDRKFFLQTLSDAIQDQSNRTLLKKLTSREQEVLELLSRGKTNKEIAEALVITPNTVKRHLKAIFEKLDIHTRSAAAVLATNWFGSDLGESID